MFSLQRVTRTLTSRSALCGVLEQCADDLISGAMVTVPFPAVQRIKIRGVASVESEYQFPAQHDVWEVITMPWLTDEDSLRHNKRAEGRLGEIWRKVANETLERTGDEGRAIREANAVIGGINERSPDPFGEGLR
jgi:hypothetical protein